VVIAGAAIEGLGAFAEENTAKIFGTESYLITQVASVGRLDRKELAAKRRYNKRLRNEDLNYLRTALMSSIPRIARHRTM
jgi:hypothetical protein